MRNNIFYGVFRDGQLQKGTNESLWIFSDKEEAELFCPVDARTLPLTISVAEAIDVAPEPQLTMNEFEAQECG